MNNPSDLSGARPSGRSGNGAIGYVFSGFHDESSFKDIVANRSPRSDFYVFMNTRGADLVTFESLAQAGALARGIAGIGRRVPAIAIAALQHKPAYRALLTTGENVGFAAAMYSRLTGSSTPVNVITHGSFFGSRYMGVVARALRGNRHVRYLTLCDSLRTQMLSRFGFAEDLVINTGYGVDTEFFKPQPQVGSARPIIASAGAATRDYRTLVAATHDLDADIRIAADSAWFPAAVDISPDRLPTNCEARSYGNYLALRELYAAASFVVVPLYPAYHACGLAVIAEAMAMGKAVITTRVAGHSDFIVEGENGFYVEPGDVAGLRSRIMELLDDPARAREMGTAARRRMASLFTLEAYVERLIQAMAQ
jgi:hypothetical protein